MRDVKEETLQKGESLFRTMAMAMVIAGVITFVAMFFPLHTKRPENAGLSYYLPWCLSYGIVDLLIAAMGVYFTTVSKDKPSLYKIGFILGIVAGGLLALSSLPLVIFLNNVEFFISVLVIGGCVIAISVVGLSSLKDQ